MKTKKCYETHTKCNGDTCNQEAMNKATASEANKHTPTPWSVEYDLAKGFAEITSLTADQTRHDYFIGRTWGIKPEDEANAEFIVRAVNSHEALLEAAKESLECFKLDDIGYGVRGPGANRMIQMLKKAIAKAEARP